MNSNAVSYFFIFLSKTVKQNGIMFFTQTFLLTVDNRFCNNLGPGYWDNEVFNDW